jgi:hypothetical protein
MFRGENLIGTMNDFLGGLGPSAVWEITRNGSISIGKEPIASRITGCRHCHSQAVQTGA